MQQNKTTICKQFMMASNHYGEVRSTFTGRPAHKPTLFWTKQDHVAAVCALTNRISDIFGCWFIRIPAAKNLEKEFNRFQEMICLKNASELMEECVLLCWNAFSCTFSCSIACHWRAHISETSDFHDLMLGIDLICCLQEDNRKHDLQPSHCTSGSASSHHCSL